jgi:Zn-dependent protease with chaperone function
MQHVKLRISVSLILFLIALSCLVIGNLISKTMVMSLGIIALPMGLFLLNPLSQMAVNWFDRHVEE